MAPLRISPWRWASATVAGSTDFPRRQFVTARPNASAGHDEPDIARGGPHEGREAARTIGDIEDHEIGALPHPDRGRGVGVRETTSAQGHLHDVAGAHVAFQPRDPIREP